MTGINSTKVTEEPQAEMQSIRQAQADMRRAYLHGSTGIIVSGTVWLVSGLVANYVSPEQAVWTLLIGGVLIHPLSIVLNKVLGASGIHAQNNPLGRLALEGTIFMIMCLPLAYGLSFHKVEWFFQGMLLIIGGRYLTFATLYGTRFYWVLGAGLGIAAYILYTCEAPAYLTLGVGAAMEIVFGLYLLLVARRAVS